MFLYVFMYVPVQTHVHEASFDAHYSPNASSLNYYCDEERIRFPDHIKLSDRVELVEKSWIHLLGHSRFCLRTIPSHKCGQVDNFICQLH